mmetsp:Transcript_28908/g.64180  ORF Transcript_28908/g.64180 Transcript_28908/m.64180 type:complete len:228 (+) Transcript_28908:501-1184(+)
MVALHGEVVLTGGGLLSRDHDAVHVSAGYVYSGGPQHTRVLLAALFPRGVADGHALGGVSGVQQLVRELVLRLVIMAYDEAVVVLRAVLRPLHNHTRLPHKLAGSRHEVGGDLFAEVPHVAVRGLLLRGASDVPIYYPVGSRRARRQYEWPQIEICTCFTIPSAHRRRRRADRYQQGSCRDKHREIAHSTAIASLCFYGGVNLSETDAKTSGLLHVSTLFCGSPSYS